MARQIIGPDVSFYQDDPGTVQEINFERMNQAADFVIIRAGQNLWADSDFKNNWRRAKEVGLPRGSYWFYDSRADPRQQAELWVNLLSGDLGELPLFLDLEEAYLGSYAGWQHWKTCLERLKALVGAKEIGIYTAYYYWNSNAPLSQPNELEYFHRYPLWIANYGVSQPLVPKPWDTSEWLFWQFTASGDGLGYGAESLEIDLNYFNGDAQAFAQRFDVSVPEDPTPPETGLQYRVNAGTLNVREGPGTNYKAIGFFQRNDVVESLESNDNGSWLRVRRVSDGFTGWCSSAYLVKITPPTPPPPPPTGERYRVNVGSLYVREGPGTNYKAVGYLVRNDIVEALEFNSDGSWTRLRRPTDGLTGWSSSQYLEKIDTTPPPPPPPPPTGEKYRVTATRLHVREGPGTEYNSLGYVELNEIVTAIGANADETWRQIRRSDGLTGWSYAVYLVLVPDSPTPEPEPSPDDVTGNWYRATSKVNARQGAGTNFAVIGSLSKDEVVEALSANADQSWIRFRRVDGWIAWASSDYLTNVGKTPASVKQNVFKGVTYYRAVSTSPHPLTSHVLEIDTKTAETLRFLVTPAVRNTVPQLCTRTTSQFLDDNDVQIAINGDEYYYMNPAEYPPLDYCATGDPVRPAGYAASRGKVYSEKLAGRPVLYINKQNEFTFDAAKGRVYNAISGQRMLVVKGKKVAGLDTSQLQPRTAFGVNQNGRWVYLVVMEGHEQASEGASFSELADLLLSYGVYTAMSFDGGGSSSMAIEGVDRLPRLLNTPVNEGTVGKERAVANHLGISLKKT
ncbi:MAG: SH3 domain-containing protein [Anaerolineales bacterium]|nr:SH3 domain-containing protein [Anaerolineales bacterium]